MMEIRSLGTQRQNSLPTAMGVISDAFTANLLARLRLGAAAADYTPLDFLFEEPAEIAPAPSCDVNVDFTLNVTKSEQIALAALERKRRIEGVPQISGQRLQAPIASALPVRERETRFSQASRTTALQNREHETRFERDSRMNTSKTREHETRTDQAFFTRERALSVIERLVTERVRTLEASRSRSFTQHFKAAGAPGILLRSAGTNAVNKAQLRFFSAFSGNYTAAFYDKAFPAGQTRYAMINSRGGLWPSVKSPDGCVYYGRPKASPADFRINHRLLGQGAAAPYRPDSVHLGAGATRWVSPVMLTTRRIPAEYKWRPEAAVSDVRRERITGEVRPQERILGEVRPHERITGDVRPQERIAGVCKSGIAGRSVMSGRWSRCNEKRCDNNG